jgi:hypothetical protein
MKNHFYLIPVGYPADELWVPDIKRKKQKKFACGTISNCNS